MRDRAALIDLSAFALFDVVGSGALEYLQRVALAERRLSAAGRTLVLVRGIESVQRVFEITRMTERLEFVETPDGLVV